MSDHSIPTKSAVDYVMWACDRAQFYTDRGDPEQARGSFSSDINKSDIAWMVLTEPALHEGCRGLELVERGDFAGLKELIASVRGMSGYGTLTDANTDESIRPATEDEWRRSAETNMFLVDRDGDMCDEGADPVTFGPFRTVYVDGGPDPDSEATR